MKTITVIRMMLDKDSWHVADVYGFKEVRHMDGFYFNKGLGCVELRDSHGDVVCDSFYGFIPRWIFASILEYRMDSHE